jgi:hypothetical protein
VAVGALAGSPQSISKKIHKLLGLLWQPCAQQNYKVPCPPDAAYCAARRAWDLMASSGQARNAVRCTAVRFP